MGNILSLQHIAGTGSYTRTFNVGTANNRLTNTVVGANTYNYTHDVRGNISVMPHLSTMGWNQQNELKNIAKGTMSAWYQYGGGQRIRKYVNKAGIKEERIYLGNYEIYRKFDASSLKIVERITLHVSDDTGRIAMLENRTFGTQANDNDTAPSLTRYIYSNHLQSASLELDDSATIISYEEYHPYGTTSYQAMNAEIQAVAKRYRYTGKERDEESGLYYHGARYYIPWLCRWVSVDPLESKYSPWSPYHYVKCNPIIDTDSTGMGGDKDLQSNQQYKEGVIHYDYAEYKGWSQPQTHGEVNRNFKVGNYDVTPYYKDGESGAKGASPAFYIASKFVKQRSEFYDERGKNSVENFTRVDFLVMPWGLNRFKQNVGGGNGYEAQADFMRASWGVLHRDILPDYLQVLDKDFKGAVWTNIKGMLKDPIFWATTAAGTIGLRGSIKATPELLQSKISQAKGGNLATAAELRVAEAYKLRGNTVELVDSDLGHANQTGTYDMTIDGVKTDVKRLQGLGRNAAGDIAKGVRQVGSGGQVIVVRPSDSKFTLQQYQTFIKNFRSNVPNVRIRVVNESQLPKLK